MKKILTKKYVWLGVVAIIAVISPVGFHFANAAGWLDAVLNPVEIVNAIVGNIAYIVLWAFMRLVWIAGVLLNISIAFSLNIKFLVETIPMIKIGWTIFRDVANMFFIFMMIWTAIRMILFGFDGQVKTSIRNLIIAAIFINFSFFLTGLAIDASNIVGKGFYDAISPNAWSPTNKSGALDGGLSSAFMKGFKIQTTFKNQDVQDAGASKDNANWINAIFISLYGSVFAIITSFVLFVVAFLAMIRTVVLLFLLMLSPLAFVGKIIPEFKKYADEWFQKLLGECLWFPLYMMMLYIVLKAVSDDSFGRAMSESGSFVEVFTGNEPGPVMIVFNFFFLSALMLGAVIIAKKVGAASVGAGMGWATKAYNTGMQGIARGGRYAVNSASKKIFTPNDANKARIERLSNSSNILTRTYGKALRRTTESSVKGNLIGAPGKFATSGAAGLLSTMTGEKIDFGSAEEDKKRAEKKDTDKRDLERTRTLNSGMRPELSDEELAKMTPADIAKYQAEREKEKEKFVKLFSEMSNAEIVKMSAKQLEQFVDFLSPRQLEAIDKSDKFIEADKKKIKDAYFAQTNRAIEDIEAENEFKAFGYDGHVASKRMDLIESDIASRGLDDNKAKRLRQIAQERLYEEQIARPSGTPLTGTNKTYFDNGEKLKARDKRSYTEKQEANRSHVRGLSKQELDMADPKMYDVNSADAKTRKRAELFIDTLSDKQFDSFVESDKTTDAQKQVLRQARIRPVVEALTASKTTRNPAAAVAEIKRISPKDLSRLDINLITSLPDNVKPLVLAELTTQKLTALMKDDMMHPDNRQKLKDAIIDAESLTTMVGGSTNTKLNTLITWWTVGKGVDQF